MIAFPRILGVYLELETVHQILIKFKNPERSNGVGK